MTLSPDGPGMVARPLRVQDGDVVWLRSVLEAYEGLAAVYGDGRGSIVVVTTESRARELDAVLADVFAESSIQPA